MNLGVCVTLVSGEKVRYYNVTSWTISVSGVLMLYERDGDGEISVAAFNTCLWQQANRLKKKEKGNDGTLEDGD